MADEKTQNPKDQAVEVKLREDFQPNQDEVKQMQEKARSVSPMLLELLEAKDYSGNDK